MKALSIRQPWAWAILHAGKDIENRTWGSAFRGRVLLHAAKGCTLREYGDAAEFIFRVRGLEVPELADLPRGAVVGAMTITDCVERSSSPWFVGPSGFVLADVKASPRIIECKGALGFFDVPAVVAEELRRAAA